MHFRNGFSTFQDVDSCFFLKGPDIVPEEAPLIFLDSKSAMCMDKNGKDTKHTRHSARQMHFVRN